MKKYLLFLSAVLGVWAFGPVLQAATVSDNFDDNEGTSYSGWTEIGGTDLYIEQNGRLEWNLGSSEIDHLTLNNTGFATNDLDIQVDTGAFDGYGTTYIYFLYQDANNWYRLNMEDATASKFEKSVGGVVSDVGAAGSGVDIVSGDPLIHWQIIADPVAEILEFYSASTQILSVSETIELSEGQVGLGGNGRRPVWDNFTVTTAGDSTPPTAPTGLAATEANCTVSLNWDDNADIDLGSYNVYRSTTSGSGYAAIATGVTASGYSDSTVSNGTSYYYVVTAVDISGNESSYSNEASAMPNVPVRYMENLGRGVVAVRNSSGAFVSWRLLALDPADVGFNLYRSTNGQAAVKLNSSVLTGATCYTDTTADLGQENAYYVKPVIGSVEQAASEPFTMAANTPTEPCFVVPLSGGSADAVKFIWVGDLDGDGEYDFIVDRHPPADASDPELGTDSQKLEAYRNDGTRLWVIDLGHNSLQRDNIEPGSSVIDVGHWDGVTVYDMDSDGMAEVIVRTANGVTFGNGATLSDSNDNHQFISVIDGLTGAERARIQIPTDYIADGPLGAQMGIGYLNGTAPSVVASMKNRQDNGDFNMMICAWDFDGSSLTQKWKWLRAPGGGYGGPYPDGHNIRVVDVDGDGLDEVCHIGFVLDSNGTLLYDLNESGIVHGDRWHIGKFDPSRPGLQGYGVQQNNPSYIYEYYYDAATGEILWAYYGTSLSDNGRGDAGDIDPRYPGFEVWSFYGVVNGSSGTQITPAGTQPWPDLRLWWDGDDLSEIWNDGKIEEWDYNASSLSRIVSTWDYETATQSGHSPMFYGDILGDWREEVVLMSSDYTKLVVFTTDRPTTRSLYTLAQNPEYRNCMTVKGYMQSHQLDYYLGDGMTTPPTPNIQIVGNTGGDTTAPAAPTSLIATAGDGSVALDWADNGEADLAGYNVYRSTTSGSGYAAIAQGVSSSAYTDNSVTNDTTYYYVVTAVDTSSNESNYSSEASATPEAPADTTPPAAPVNLAATAGDGSVALDWDDNGEADLAGYNVYRSTTSGSGYAAIAQGVSSSAYTDNSVTNETTYYYVVTAVDTSSNESNVSSEASATPQAQQTAEMYVNSIVMGSRNAGPNYWGQATVHVKDDSGANVSGATVYGTWSGAYSGTVSGTTAADGTVFFETADKVKNGGTFTFTVTDVTVNGKTYNATLNVETSDSITVP